MTIQSPLAVATDGYICNSPSFPLSVWTRGYLCLILIVEEEIQRGGYGGDYKLWPRKPKFGDYKYTKKDLEELEKQAEFIKQNTQDEEEMVTLMMLSMIYGLLK